MSAPDDATIDVHAADADERTGDTENRSKAAERFRLTFGEPDDGPILLEQAFDQTRMAMCVSDPLLPDNPIVYANRAFEELTGYAASEIVGRNCRFLQGELTDQNTIEELRKAIRDENVCILEILNYTKAGDAFWNALHVGPIYDANGKLRYFFGSQWDVTNVHAARVLDQQTRTINKELNHRIKNLFAVIGSIVSLSAIGATDPDEAALRARERIAALGRAHEATINPTPEASTAYLSVLVDEVVTPFKVREQEPVVTKGDEVVLQISAITPLGLILHELATNSIKYGTLGGHGEGLELTWARVDADGPVEEALTLEWRDRSDSGRPESAEDGMGTKIIKAMVQSFAGTFDVLREDGAYVIRISLPAGAVLL